MRCPSLPRQIAVRSVQPNRFEVLHIRNLGIFRPIDCATFRRMSGRYVVNKALFSLRGKSVGQQEVSTLFDKWIHCYNNAKIDC